MDDHEERYVKVAREMEHYFVLQFGLSVFRKKQEKYTANTYNIFVSPTLPSSKDRHRDFTRQYKFLGSTMAFLASHKYDFNTTLKEGVPFLTRSEEKRMKVRT